MAKQPTKYEAERQICVDLATRKAKIHGRSEWPFNYRGQQVVVSVTKVGNDMRVRTDAVKNKGK